MKNKKFTKNDLKIGYIVICNNIPHMVMVGSSGSTVLIDNERGYLHLDDFNDDLVYKNDPKEWNITEVYGYSGFYHKTLELSTFGRELLWKREDSTKKMTVEEIEKELGYKVEIVS